MMKQETINSQTIKRKATNKRVCSICKTTKFRKTDEGMVCKYGHQLLGFQVEEHDTEVARGGRQRKRYRIDLSQYDAPSPAKQKSDFLQIIQFSLQVIGRAMVQDLGFPQELEPTLRELWLLFLTDSKTELHEAYVFEANQSQRIKTEEIVTIKKEVSALDQLAMEEELLEKDYEEDEEVEMEIFNRKASSRMIWAPVRYSDILSFIYLACVYLNYPIILNDLIRWSHQGLIPYLSMQERIPPAVLNGINIRITNTMTIVPTIYILSRRTHSLCRRFQHNCKVKFPPLNIPLYLERLCSQFHLPVQGYYYADYIFKSYSEKYNLQPVPTTSHSKSHPVTVLAACVLSAINIIYGLCSNKVDNDRVSKHNPSWTKQEWLLKIKENLNTWKESERYDTLDHLIRYLKQASFAAKSIAHPADKQSMLLNVINTENHYHYRHRINLDTPEKQLFMFPKQSVLDGTQETKEPIEEGHLYYSHKFGFKTQDYLDLLELATLIVGEPIEYMLKVVDKHMLKTNDTKVIPVKEYRTYFPTENS